MAERAKGCDWRRQCQSVHLDRRRQRHRSVSTDRFRHALSTEGILVQIIKEQSVHDVVVIGSGAAGGMAAWNLTRQGVNVLMLDAGTLIPRSRFWTHVKPWEWRARMDRGQKPPEFYLSLAEQPYDTPAGQPFELTRVSA